MSNNSFDQVAVKKETKSEESSEKSEDSEYPSSRPLDVSLGNKRSIIRKNLQGKDYVPFYLEDSYESSQQNSKEEINVEKEF
jgi:hypothetical protein